MDIIIENIKILKLQKHLDIGIEAPPKQLKNVDIRF
jgi:hypothetical protein